MSTAALVKELRELTGAPMMDCKKALAACNDSIQDAADWLRKRSTDVAVKKAGRVSAEGLVAARTSEGLGVIVELNSETDFVAKNTDFIALAGKLAEAALKDGGVHAEEPGNIVVDGKPAKDVVVEAIGKIGENIVFRRAGCLKADSVTAYVHNSCADGVGKIAVLVGIALNGADKAKIADFAKKVAMHVAAFRPQSLDVASLNPAAVQRERDILTEQAQSSGKPAAVIEKMIEGRIKKFYGEVVLLEQPFVMDNKITVSEALAEEKKVTGGDPRVTGYLCYVAGEGIEKKEENFAEEAAKIAAGAR